MKYFLAFLLVTIGSSAMAQTAKEIQHAVLKESYFLDSCYQHLHAHPELSTREIKTSAYLKKTIASYGFEIIDSLGLYSFAAVLRNGKGPAILYRTDMDGLPVKEQTGLTFASMETAEKDKQTVAVMHACGHDIHMTTWLGIAKQMSDMKSKWKGTLILLAQSAEETAQGAKRVVNASAFGQLPKPDAQLAIHDHAELKTGQAGFCDGYALAAVDMLNITIYGKGGHGAAPQNTIDPILLSAQFINEIQTIVSRNLSSNDPAVITVGSINGGTIGNVIPDQVVLKLTIRSYSNESRALIFKRLHEIANGLAKAAGLPDEKMPLFDLLDMSIPAVYNDPALGNQLRTTMVNAFGSNSVTTVKPVMIGEDFSIYGQQETKIPSYLIWMGTVSENRSQKYKQENKSLPSLHAASFAPDYHDTIQQTVSMMTFSLLSLFSK
jgi:hippurate hydrolase